ncbi:AarF/ABC1/UbiB kinase family protein [bacterium]|nr:AarF/ABC1/UbiB kinase family protein [candidate division CSSED10-310 bacterium]
MTLWRINRTYRNIQRMQTILNVLLKHGFGQLIRKMGLHRLLPLGKQASALSQDDTVSPLDPLTMSERLRLALEELGPTFIKFGQILSTRPDIVPETFIIELRKLREDNRPLPYPSIRKALEESLGDRIENVFSTLDEKPIATASIGQVHSGVLRTGEKVVVKIRRPGIERIVRNDLDILNSLAAVLSRRIEEMASFDPEGLVREFEKTILREMDFSIEAMNMERFRQNLASEQNMAIPHVYWQYSSRSVIVMEKLRGIRMESADALRAAGHDPEQLAVEGMRVFFRQVLEFGLFHADPHPGNVLALPDGRIGLIDFGMIGRLDPQTSEHLGSLIMNIIQRDYDRMLISLRKLGFEFDELGSPDLRRELMEIVEVYYGRPLRSIGIGDLLSKLIETIMHHRVKLPGGFLTLIRAMVISEGVGRQLFPGIDVIAISEPMIRKIVRAQNDPLKLAEEMMTALGDLRHTATVLPRYMEILFQRLLRGKLRIEFSHTNLDRFYREIERTGNRLSFSIVVAALILGSSIIMYSRLGPFIFGYPALGVIGYMLAALLGIGLLINIIRSGRV